MKKILALLLVAGAITTVSAQSREEARRVILGGGNGTNSNGGGRDVILGDGNNGDSYPTYPGSYPSSSSRQAEIDRINRDYDNKVQSIRNNPYLSHEEKERSIRQLERDRQARLRQINNSYKDYGRNDRKDNGKHKGWYKKQKNKNWKKGKKDRDWDDD